MKEVILKVDNVSKQYRLGVIGTGTITHDFNRWWHKVRGKEDPYLKIGEVNNRSTVGDSEYVWALNDINFEVREGEVLGIIGKNGAGKSTLLKILSKVTGPTTGEIKTRGRIASLLEVGTGFHREMTGRENIYLNGAILGMTKKEIHSKIEEIIDFSGCERYIDTPVKRYSSGMTVRLAFAVAAFLEPEILVIDEVLAVGDAEFQKKAIGKMQDISKGQGRTVLFVSHNMAAIQDLCTRLLVLDNGTTIFEGDVSDGINMYLNAHKVSNAYLEFDEKPYIKAIFSKFEILNNNEKISSSFKSGESINFRASIKIKQPIRNPIFSLRITDINNVNIVCWRSNDFVDNPIGSNIENDIKININSKDLFLLDNVYMLSMSFLDGKELLDFKKEFISFEVLPSSPSEKYYSITKRKTSNSVIFYQADWSIS